MLDFRKTRFKVQILNFRSKQVWGRQDVWGQNLPGQPVLWHWRAVSRHLISGKQVLCFYCPVSGTTTGTWTFLVNFHQKKIVGRGKSVKEDNLALPTDSFLLCSSLPAHGYLQPQKSQPAINHRGLWVGGGLVWHVAPLVAPVHLKVAVALLSTQADIVIITWGSSGSSSAWWLNFGGRR